MKIVISEKQYGLLYEKYSDKPFNPIKTAITSTLAKGLNLPHSSKKERELYTDIVREIEKGNFEMVKEPTESYWGGDDTEVKVVLYDRVYFVKPTRERINIEGTIMCSVKISYDNTWFHIYGCKHFKKLTELIKNKRLSKIETVLSKLPLLLSKMTNGEIKDAQVEHYYMNNEPYMDVNVKIDEEVSKNNSESDIRKKYSGIVKNALKTVTGGELTNFKINLKFI